MMLRTLSIRTGLLSLLAVMTLLLILVSGIGIYALTQSCGFNVADSIKNLCFTNTRSTN